LFLQDDWRVNAKWTFNLGLRYEYVGPYTEANNRLANIDHNANFTAVKEVFPGQVGPISGQRFSSSLVNPDRNNFAPRIGIAWKAAKKTVVRAGYGINFNTGAYSNFVQTLAFQPPFTFTQTNAATLGTGLPGMLQVQNAFPAPAVGALTNNYAVDSNYRLGYAQTWNANIQQDLGHNITMNLNYTGTKGTHLDELTAPNRTATGVLVPNVQPYNFLTSLGDSIYHGGTLNLRRRFNHGWSLNGSYTFSKSIDNASGVGGAANIVAQNALDLAAERGPSSFDERHKFNTSLTYELPFGTNKKLLAGKGFANKAFGNWTMNSNFSANSGAPLTIHVLGNFSDVARGSNGTLRANPVTGVPVYASSQTLTSYLNNAFLKTIGALAPFTVPATGTYGTLGRNTVRGPGSWDLDSSISKNFPLKESRAIDFRASFSNILNHARWTSIDSNLGSPTFGQVVGIGGMRHIQFNMSFRF
jgi:hypothetical protein